MVYTRIALSCSLLLGLLAAVSGADAPRSRSYDFVYATRVTDIPAGTQKVDLWLPYPVSDENQDVKVAVTSAQPYRVVREGANGNSALYLSIAKPAGPEVAVEMQVRVTRRELARSVDGAAPGKAAGAEGAAELAKWLKPDLHGALDERVRQIAAEVTSGKTTDLEKARAIYDYVVKTMSYDKSGTGWGNGDIQWACDAKRGNCTDFHALFMGLCRAAGIPARFHIGFPIPADQPKGEIGGYHCWAEFYLKDRGWIPVDGPRGRTS